jgi:RNA polymerase sigma factor (sigma-70 family)
VNDDFQLLHRYAAEGSEAAFGELVRRHANLVYAAAFRRLNGRSDLAEEVAQQVFVDLARKAASFKPDMVMGGWLHRHTVFVSATALRTETRRLNREREANSMNETQRSGTSLLEQLGPELDSALDELSTTDRDALVLRFLERCDLRQVGAVLGLTDDAAQKRVARALEKLRAIFVRRGYAVPVVALSAFLFEAAAVTAPAAFLAKTTTAACTAATATVASTAVINTKGIAAGFFMMNKAKIALLTLIALAGTTTIVLQLRGKDHPEEYQGTTQVSISGTAGAVFTGFYIKDAQRVAISNAVPWNFQEDRVSSFEIRKGNPADTLTLNMRYDGNGAHATMTRPLQSGTALIRVRIRNGLIAETITREK